MWPRTIWWINVKLLLSNLSWCIHLRILVWILHTILETSDNIECNILISDTMSCYTDDTNFPPLLPAWREYQCLVNVAHNNWNLHEPFWFHRDCFRELLSPRHTHTHTHTHLFTTEHVLTHFSQMQTQSCVCTRGGSIINDAAYSLWFTEFPPFSSSRQRQPPHHHYPHPSPHCPLYNTHTHMYTHKHTRVHTHTPSVLHWNSEVDVKWNADVCSCASRGADSPPSVPVFAAAAAAADGAVTTVTPSLAARIQAPGNTASASTLPPMTSPWSRLIGPRHGQHRKPLGQWERGGRIGGGSPNSLCCPAGWAVGPLFYCVLQECVCVCVCVCVFIMHGGELSEVVGEIGEYWLFVCVCVCVCVCISAGVPVWEHGEHKII